jgi:hypothetical protein
MTFRSQRYFSYLSLICFTLLILIFLSLSQAYSQPSSTVSPNNIKDSNVDGKNHVTQDRRASLRELLTLAIKQSESKYRSDPSPSNYSAILYNHERKVYHECFTNLHVSLSYNPNKVTDECIQARNELLRLHPSNSAGVCARDGFISPSCRNAVITIVQRTGVLRQPSFADPETRGKKISVVKSQLKGDFRQFEKSSYLLNPPSKEDQEKYETFLMNHRNAVRILNRLIVLECSEEEFDIESPPTMSASSLVPESKVLNPMTFKENDRTENGIRLGVANSPSVTEEDSTTIKAILLPNAPFVRSRYISEECQRVLSSGRKVIPKFPGIACAEYGRYTPQCLESIKDWRIKISDLTGNSNSPSANPKKDLGTFEEF